MIECQNLCKTFGDRQVVKDVSLEIPEGEVYGFLGPNGAGKSTTTRMLCTLLSITSGQAKVAGFDVSSNSQDVRLNVGVALQEVSLDPKQTGMELLNMQADLYAVDKKIRKNRIDDLISMVDIGDSINKLTGSYSGGMKRRLDLAIALIHEPKVLFLDEPTTGLDPQSRQMVWEEVARLNKDSGNTIFLTTQYLEEADQLANRIGIITDGSIAVEGTPTDLKASVGDDVITLKLNPDDCEKAKRVIEKAAKDAKVSIKDDEVIAKLSYGPAMLSPIAVELSNEDIAVKAINLHEPTLDDVFFAVTGGYFEGNE